MTYLTILTSFLQIILYWTEKICSKSSVAWIVEVEIRENQVSVLVKEVHNARNFI